MARGLTILMYHRVLEHEDCLNYPLESLVIPREVFAQQVDFLSSRYCVLPVHEAMNALRADANFNRPIVALTFDDGYADNAEIVAPILEKYGVRGTFFVTSGFVAEREAMWFDRAAAAWASLDDAARHVLFVRALSERGESGVRDKKAPSTAQWMQALKDLSPHSRQSLVDEAMAQFGQEPDRESYRPMSVAQLRKLKQAGHEIGAHSVTHPILPQLDERVLAREIGESKRHLEGWLGEPVDGFCYPNGDVDDRVEAATRRAGFKYACATTSGLNESSSNPYRLHRVSISMHRTLTRDGGCDIRGFRAEISRLREWFR